MRTAEGPALSIVAGATLLQGANGFLQALLPLRLQAAGVSTTEFGLVAAAYGFGFMGGCLATPWCVRRVGFIRAFITLAALLAIIALAFALATHISTWMALRAANGACMAGLFTIIEGWISARAQNSSRGRVLASYMVASKLALTVGPLLVGIAPVEGDRLFMALSALLLLALLPVAFTLADPPAPPRLVTLGLRDLTNQAPSAFVGCFLIGLINAPVVALAPLYGRGMGLSVEAAAALLIVLQGGNLLLQWPLGWLSDRLDRRVVIALIGAGTAVVSAVIAGMPTDAAPTLIYAAIAGWGGLALCAYAICVAHACDLVPPERVVPTISGLLLAWAAGAMIGPLPGAMLMDLLGPRGLFVFTGAASAALALYVVVRMVMNRRPRSARHAFVALLPNSPASGTLTPQAERCDEHHGARSTARDLPAYPPHCASKANAGNGPTGFRREARSSEKS